MPPTRCSSTFRPLRALLVPLALSLCLAGAARASGGHAGFPSPSVELLEEVVSVPFVLPEAFPVPVVEVTLNGSGPWRLAVDTAMGGTVLLREELARSLGLPVVGKALVGDSSGATRPAELVQIREMLVGSLKVRDVVGIGFAAGDEHLEKVPDDLHGILGNQIYAELLATLDYPNRRLELRKGSLDRDRPGTVAFEDRDKVMVVDLELPGSTVAAIIDSGSRGTITLPRSAADALPLSQELRAVDSLSTVSATYQREAARLDGEASLAGIRLLAPELVFADEDSPQLIGFGVLRHFAITIDQQSRRIRFEPATEPPLRGIDLAP